MAGMRDVAKEAGVSLSTVSSAFSGNGYISDEVMEKVKNAANKVGYQIPDNKKKNIIAVLLPVITSAYYSNILNGIENTVAEKGYTVLFGNSGFDFDKGLQFLKTIQRQSLCGIILNFSAPAEREKDFFKLLKKDFVDKNIPVVFIDQFIENNVFFSIDADYYKNSFISTEHLIKNNRKCIVHLTGHPGKKGTLMRINGYRDALDSHNIPYDEGLIINGDFSPNSGYIAMKNFMTKRSDFTALYAANDQMAIGAMKAMKSYGKSVPNDIMVIGGDNVAVSSLITPALSTVNIPTYQMGHTAAKIILDAQQGISNEKKHKMECNLIIRQSTEINANSEWELFGW
jgi:LacI family transcriptional regulator/LacI family repressor for deo operon, udp, cdd, tsx, nupC, and nupG